ncbi:hypothetical protein Csa_017586 [Cucumis sativus]|nr:hypothetical protein Csa_017586 [Cucumis sativus]
MKGQRKGEGGKKEITSHEGERGKKGRKEGDDVGYLKKRETLVFGTKGIMEVEEANQKEESKPKESEINKQWGFRKLANPPTKTEGSVLVSIKGERKIENDALYENPALAIKPKEAEKFN